MKSRHLSRVGFIFTILIILLASLGIGYAGFTGKLWGYGTIDTYTPSGDCKTPGFWKTEFKYWLTGQGHPHVPLENLTRYCSDIYVLFFDEVFGFEDPEVGVAGLSFQETYDILSVTGGSMKNTLRKHLMAAELNYVSDDYQADDNALFGFFIHGAEEALVNESEGEYEYWKDLLDSYNNQWKSKVPLIEIDEKEFIPIP